ncbi:uncharacterized protein LOC126319930 [Schistocerca gregaria]|uniref:uncharacterized protein LOC126319930 n=1 Tax=Schistocerca gregaria TaxID=7010 RepID=UPI00211E7670|nr:uncharacterized protein LOC126319930 [Schistocerca gregaria]XP_049849595.1 uncharacterized protein LOC126319930 [Schistocerca gregaria]XP_049849596.1 uncharacterized protein LOC126319930 [Schistocerca gregaria]
MSKKYCSILILALLLLNECTLASYDRRRSTAIVFSGGGSRIGQQLAMLMSLFTGDNAGHVKVFPDFISGSSSGSVCAILANALYRTVLDPLSPPYTPDRIRQLLLSIKEESVIDLSISGLEKVIFDNLFDGYIFNNHPLRQLLSKELEYLKFEKLKDLYIPTCIAVTDTVDGKTYSLCSDDPNVNELPLIDIVMASTAIPGLFKPQSIAAPQSYGSGKYMDGSFGRESIPAIPAFMRNINIIYLVTHSDNSYSFEVKPVPHYNYLHAIFQLSNLFVSLTSSIFDISTNFMLEMWKCHKGSTIYLFQPDIDDGYNMVDFNSIYKQYETTLLWTAKNQPICLNCGK